MDAVVHLAGIAHIGTDVSDDTYDRVNRLRDRGARARRRNGRDQALRVRLVDPGAERHARRPSLSESDPPQPTEAYGRSKLAAEEAVRASGVPYTILRPVLVYGRGDEGQPGASAAARAPARAASASGGSQASARCSAWTI